MSSTTHPPPPPEPNPTTTTPPQPREAEACRERRRAGRNEKERHVQATAHRSCQLRTNATTSTQSHRSSPRRSSRSTVRPCRVAHSIRISSSEQLNASEPWRLGAKEMRARGAPSRAIVSTSAGMASTSYRTSAPNTRPGGVGVPLSPRIWSSRVLICRRLPHSSSHGRARSPMPLAAAVERRRATASASPSVR